MTDHTTEMDPDAAGYAETDNYSSSEMMTGTSIPGLGAYLAEVESVGEDWTGISGPYGTAQALSASMASYKRAEVTQATSEVAMDPPQTAEQVCETSTYPAQSVNEAVAELTDRPYYESMMGQDDFQEDIDVEDSGVYNDPAGDQFSTWRVEKSEKYAHRQEKKVENTELKIGISEYLGTHSGFFGIIKQRYSDFIVNEVTSDGEIVHLTDKTVPPVPEHDKGAPEEHPPELTKDIMDQIEDMIGPPRPARINVDGSFTEGKKESLITEITIDVNNVPKEGRKNIHLAIKNIYGPKVTSSYKEDPDGNKSIVIYKSDAVRHIKMPKRAFWPKTHTNTTFVLYKENVDTIDAVNILAKYAGIKANLFSYAGTKDKRGKTSQLVSVPRVAPEKLSNAAYFRRCLHIGNFMYKRTPQKLGQLRGNKFHIVLRDVKGEDEQIVSAIESLKTNGFINYFGSQRFSTTSVGTHLIGRELLKSNWHKAVNLILAPRENEVSILNDCRTVWKETGDAEAALMVLKHDQVFSIEGRLLTGLQNVHKNDLVGALGLIPRNVRLLYLHAYQSYVWNMVVSRRIKTHGLKVLPGDIIRRKDVPGPSDNDICEEEYDGGENGHSDAEGNGTEETEVKKDGEQKKKLDISNFHFLSEEEAETTDICDVLLPLPGYQVEYPKNEIRDWYVELLEGDELSLSSLKHKVKCYSVGGMYRRIVAHPTDVSSSIAYYSDPSKPLIASDLDRFKGESVEENLLQEGPYKAVLLEMTLASSTYATMALRELLKMDTSSEFQATLNEPPLKTRDQFFSKELSKKRFKRDYHGRDRRGGNGHRNRKGGKNSKGSHGRRRFQGGGSRQAFGKGNKGKKRQWKGAYENRGKRPRIDLDF